MAGLSVGVAHPGNLVAAPPSAPAKVNITTAPQYHQIAGAGPNGQVAVFAPGPAPAASSGGGGGGSTYDPAAAAAAAAAARARADYNSLATTTNNSIGDAINNAAGNYHGSILDYLDSERTQQNAINNKAIQNELSKLTGTAGVLDMVGHGLKSGGVMLANRNATTSSAAGALARAYGDIGRRQLSSVGNQYQLGANDIKVQQDALAQANATEIRHAKENKANVINSIVGSAINKLTALNQAAASANLPDRVNIEARKAEITRQAMGALSAYDAVLSQGIAKNAPTSVEHNRGEASKLSQAGTAPSNAFTFDSSIPPEFQNTGPFPSQFPVFPVKGDKTKANPLPIAIPTGG